MLELIKYIVEQFAEEKDAISYDVEETEDTITVTVLLAEWQDRQGAPHARARGNAQGQQEVQRGDQGTPSGVNGFPRALCGKRSAERLFAFFRTSGVFQEGKRQKRMRNRRQNAVFLCKLRFGESRMSTKCTKKIPESALLFGGKGLQIAPICGIILTK